MSVRSTGLAIVVSAHVVVIVALLNVAPPRATPPRATEPLVVSVITPPRFIEAPPQPKPVKARVVARAAPQPPAAPVSRQGLPARA